MTSAEDVCCKQLPDISDEFKYRSKQGGPGSDCSYRSSLIWVQTVCHKDFLNISADEKKQTTFVAIGAFRVNAILVLLQMSRVHWCSGAQYIVNYREIRTCDERCCDGFGKNVTFYLNRFNLLVFVITEQTFIRLKLIYIYSSQKHMYMFEGLRRIIPNSARRIFQLWYS